MIPLRIQPGQRFGRLTVIRVIPGNRSARRMAECACDCGALTTTEPHGLAYGRTKSCGCLSRAVIARSLVHGLHHHPLYKIWWNMLARCENPDHHAYQRYGGRGITVWPAWHDLAAFVADIEREIGPRPEGRHPSGRAVWTLDRIDNDGPYAPGNVQWSTAQQQIDNRQVSR